MSDAVKPTDSQCGRCGPGPRRLSALRRLSAHTGTQAKPGSTAPHSGLRNTNNIQKRELSRLLNSKGFAVRVQERVWEGPKLQRPSAES